MVWKSFSSKTSFWHCACRGKIWHLRRQKVACLKVLYHFLKKAFLDFQWWKYTFYNKCSKNGLVSEKNSLFFSINRAEGINEIFHDFFFLNPSLYSIYLITSLMEMTFFKTIHPTKYRKLYTFLMASITSPLKSEKDWSQRMNAFNFALAPESQYFKIWTTIASLLSA